MLNIIDDQEYNDQLCFSIECWGRRLRFLQENGIDIASIREYTIENLINGDAEYWWRRRRDMVYETKHKSIEEEQI
jgi:hypothetical protein